MKSYIVLNTWLRTSAKTELKKDFFNLMNNNVFGKIMENVRNHKDIKLVKTREKYAKHVNPFLKDLFAVEMGKTEFKMVKQVYLG